MFVDTSVYKFSTFVCLYMCAFMCALCMHVHVFIVNSIVSSMSSRPSGLYLLDTNSSSYLTPGCDIKKNKCSPRLPNVSGKVGASVSPSAENQCYSRSSDVILGDEISPN